MIKIFQVSLFLISMVVISQSNTEVFLFDLVAENVNMVSNFKNISNNEGYDNQPSFLDHDTLFFAGTRNGQTDILKFSLSTETRQWLSNTEGSEYSPVGIPNRSTISAVRLEKDGKQFLYAYDVNNTKPELLVDGIVIGYYTWINANTLVSATLNGETLDLTVSDLEKSSHIKVASNVGRSLHQVPNSNLVSFISKEDASSWQIKSLNVKTQEIKTIAPTLPNVEDMCWLPNVNILAGKDSELYILNPGEKTWKNFLSLKNYGITNITRLAVSPDGTKLAVVGELLDQKIEPKLENIAWIAGNWKGEAFGGQTEENWSEPSAGSMMATFKLINKGKVSFYEIEIIRELENTLILQLKHFDNTLKGWETKDETVDFPLKEITTNKVVFEGMTFEKVSENEMNVYVDMHQNDGSMETVKINYKK